MRRSMAFILIAVCLATASATEPESYRLKLRPRATVYQAGVTVGDVVSFADAPPQLVEHVANHTLLERVDGQPRAVVTHEQLVDELDALGVNLGRVLIGGALRCEVAFKSSPQATPDESGEQASAPLVRLASEVQRSGPLTLADVVQAHAAEELSELGGTVELHFERAGNEFLELTTPPWEFKVSSSHETEQLGLREFRVLIRRNGRAQRTVHVFAQVRLTRKTVVARRPLSLGNYIRRDDVTCEQRVFGAGDDLGFGELERVVGQQVKRFVPQGALIPADAVKPSDLVRRGRPVTLLSDTSGIQVRFTGVALDAGGYGETVRVRLGDRRRGKQMLRGVVTGLGTVRLAEGSL